MPPLNDAKDLFGGDGEAAEIRQLRGRATLHNYVIISLGTTGRPTGIESELNAALGIDPIKPLSACSCWPAKSRKNGQRPTPTRPLMRGPGWTGCLRKRRRPTWEYLSTSVSPGVANYPITTAGGATAQTTRAHRRRDSVSAWTVGVTELKAGTEMRFFLEYSAKRIQLRIPMLEEALIRDLRMALVEALDLAIFVGDDGANEDPADIIGLQTAANVTEKTLTQANKVKADKVVQAFNSLVDGVHSRDLDDLKIVVSEGTYQLWTGTVLNVAGETASVFKTLSQFLNDSRVMWQTRELESATSNGKFGAYISRARGLTGAAVAPVWNSAELIRDPYSKAKSGQVLLTLTAFWNFGLPRPANFARLKYTS